MTTTSSAFGQGGQPMMVTRAADGQRRVLDNDLVATRRHAVRELAR
jgi:hypothetical protein